jgi:hypothetical protein
VSREYDPKFNIINPSYYLSNIEIFPIKALYLGVKTTFLEAFRIPGGSILTGKHFKEF